MLINHPIMERTLVPVTTQRVARWTTENIDAVAANGGEWRETTAQAIVDRHRGKERLLAVRSSRYSLVPNSQLFSALDLAADQLNVSLEPATATYYAGRTRATFKVPSMQFDVRGDQSPSVPTIIIDNDYRGGSSIRGHVGIFRLICSNGAVAGYSIAKMVKRHVGSVSEELLPLMVELVEQMVAAADVAKITAEVAMNTPIGGEALDKMLDQISKGTNRRYRNELDRVVEQNLSVLGGNAWAFIQGLSEMATHVLPEKNSTQNWSDKWIDRVLREVGVQSEVAVLMHQR